MPCRSTTQLADVDGTTSSESRVSTNDAGELDGDNQTQH